MCDNAPSKTIALQCWIKGEKKVSTSGAISNQVSKGRSFPTSKNCNYILQWENEVRTFTYIQHQPSRFWLAGIAQIEEHFHTSCIH